MTLGQRFKVFLNPMFIAMIIGIGIGLSGIVVPGWIGMMLNSASDCMSPVVMPLRLNTIVIPSAYGRTLPRQPPIPPRSCWECRICRWIC